MTHRTDDKSVCLVSVTGQEGASDDLERLWLLSVLGGPPERHIDDLWLAWFWLQGATALDVNDAARQYFNTQGYEGEISDQWAQFWSTCPITPPAALRSLPPEPNSENIETINRLEDSASARDALIMERHAEFDQKGIEPNLPLEERFRLYQKAGYAPSVQIERVKQTIGEYTPPHEHESTTVTEYSAQPLNFKAPIHDCEWEVTGGKIIEEKFNRIKVETVSGVDTAVTLKAEMWSANKRAKAQRTFIQQHRALLPPEVVIECVRPGSNGYRPPNDKSKADGEYQVTVKNYNQRIKNIEWACEGGSVVFGQGTDTCKVLTEGAGTVAFSLHCAIDDYFGTAEFKHEHPELPSFEQLKKQHSGVQRSA